MADGLAVKYPAGAEANWHPDANINTHWIPFLARRDEGKARLVNGVARVNVDPIFLETIEGDFLIHVTPYGDAVLYVAEVGEDYFVVRAREGSDDVAFAWLLTAARKGYAGVRLEGVRTAD